MSPYRHIHPLLGLRPWRQHSLVLAVGGAVYFLLGWVYILTPLTPNRADALRLPLMWTEGSMDAWGAAWVTIGLLAFVSTRWPITSERWGYVAMSSLSALWATFHLVAIPLGATISNAIVGLLAWSLFGFLWWAISGLRNPEDHTGIDPTEGG